MQIRAIAIFCLTPLIFSSCVRDGFRQHANLMKVESNKGLYREVAVKYVNYAAKGNAEGMMSITSSLTVKNAGGPEEMKAQQRNHIDWIQGARITWDDEGTVVKDRFGYTGVTFHFSGDGKKGKFGVTLGVVAEKGGLKVALILPDQ